VIQQGCAPNNCQWNHRFRFNPEADYGYHWNDWCDIVEGSCDTSTGNPTDELYAYEDGTFWDDCQSGQRVLDENGEATAELEKASALTWTAEELSTVKLQPSPVWNQSQVVLSSPTAAPSDGPTAPPSDEINDPSPSPSASMILLSGIVVLSGITESEFEGDEGLQNALRTDIADMVAVDPDLVELVSISGSGSGSERMILQDDGVRVGFEITIPGGADAAEAIILQFETSFAAESVSMYAAENGYDSISASFVDVAIDGVDSPSASPTRPPENDGKTDESTIPIAVAVVASVVLMGLIVFLRTRRGKKEGSGRNGKNIDQEMTGVNPGAPLQDSV